MPEQLSFNLPVRQALGREDFFVSPSNATAVTAIETWTDWPNNKLLLVGPAGSGKTHLAHVWASQSGANIIDAAHLAEIAIDEFATQNAVVDDASKVAGNERAESALFHLHNLLLSDGHSLLLTADSEAAFWGIELPDLASRMQGTHAAVLNDPDDPLLRAVLMKLMSDRQLLPTPNTIPYLARRIDRSFAAARDIVAKLDQAALSQGRRITRDLARKLLDKSVG